MAYEIVMPRMGLTMEEGTVVAWLKAEGDPVKTGEPLLEIETDKTTVEIEAPNDGILGQITGQPGDTLPVGTVIGYLLQEGEAPPAYAGKKPADTKAADLDAGLESSLPAPAPVVRDQALAGKIKASPAARHLASKLEVDLARVSGTGPDGRVVAWNVEAAAESAASETGPDTAVKASPLARRLAADLGVTLGQVQGTGPGGRVTRQDVEMAAGQAERPVEAGGEVVPVSRAHRIMADRMAASFGQAPHFYLHVEVDARQLVALRRALLPRIEALSGLRVTLTDLLVRLCGITLSEHPALMGQWAGDGLRQSQDVNVGIAMDTPAGLIVPVIRDADEMPLVNIVRSRVDLVERARAGKLLPQDLEGGVFTLSNLGMFNIDSFDAILNPPQAAILAIGRIKERAIVEQGQVVPAEMMNLSLSVDHRVLDGAAGARFLGDLAQLIENPNLAWG